ncbi:sugar-transfer associated ATP-grasp domain-containing protein [Nitrosomonas eutropha]|uniref:Polysaccharide biosynthesis protein n=2 Tax=Nitrosomonas eutropha TaxID=916 RepID=A0ABX5M8X0_9PROT|nr:sugar-transfer associated ATP-grasp domain-containing protein [Nitrosomonas eutropha]ABI59166.1 conserved hypothetical protein [Nitrosomonas eutropha C91]PXV83470.1 putative polysaccharide biosynthesis protein [Nitrosomonas eutropha]SEI63872.1 Sugar-transfer associated ATP-grasp [Nitrosomonas eutropha]
MANFIRKLIQTLTAIRLETKRYEHSTIHVIINWLTAFRKDLFSAREIRLYGLANPEDGENRIQQYVSKEMADHFYRKYNLKSAVPNIEDKFVFITLCIQHHLPIPATYGIFKQGIVKKLDGQFFQGLSNFRDFIRELKPGAYLLKPNNGMLGLGLFRLEIKDQSDLKFQDEPITADDLYKKLCSIETVLPASSKGDSVDRDFEGLLFQQRLANHPEITKLTSFRMLQTIRVCTYVTDDHQVEILFAFMKLAGKEGLADAFNLGRTGNMLAKIDPATGRFCKVYAMDQQQGYLVEITRHAVTQANLLSFTAPHWQACLALAEKLAIAFLPLRAVGWDIAITNEGPVALEGNNNWVPVVPFDISANKLKQYKLKS